METASPQTSSEILCSFCKQADNQSHQCRADIFNVLNRLAQVDRQNPFSDVENLVFQGGGVKGLAYLGALSSLFDENSHNIGPKIKRVAGSSAGAIAALYVSLGLKMDAIEKYMKTEMLTLLEDEPKVAAEYEPIPVKEVLRVFLLHAHQDGRDEVKKFIKQVINDTLHKNTLAVGATILSWLGSDKGADMLLDSVYAGIKLGNYDDLMEKIKALQKEVETEEPNNNKAQAFQQEHESDRKKGNVLNFFLGEIASGLRAVHEGLMVVENQIAKTYYQGKHLVLGKTDLEKSDSVFYETVSDLIQKTFVNVDGNFNDGWFVGSQIKQKLIIEPIQEAFSNVDQSHLFHNDLTFGELANVKVDGKPAFKKLYVTAFNTATGKTEIFSADHTPDVVVADAVRASMSIPIFFKAVKIREKGADQQFHERKIYAEISEKKFVPKETYYMDGGILDNYPIWIFDDLQYIVGETFAKEWKPIQRIPIRNPFTLGLKLINSDLRKIALKPYVEDNFLQPKVIKLPDDPTPFGLIKTYLSAEAQENVHLHSGDASRTIYVDNLGVSAIAFDMIPTQISIFEMSGKWGVQQYINYFKLKKLSGIGQRYIPIQRTPIQGTL